MVAYSFKPQFVEPILWGRKDQTIRALRLGALGHVRPGQPMQLYTGMRTKHCRLIFKTTCIELLQVWLRWRPIVEVIIDGEKLPLRDFDGFARRDGFSDFEAMERFWAQTHGAASVFDGEMPRWRAPSAPVEMGASIE
jgi:hypothetical protein